MTPHDKNKLRIRFTSSSSNVSNRNSSGGVVNSWVSAWLLHVSDGKDL